MDCKDSFFADFLPQSFPLPLEPQSLGFGRQDGYLARFSPSFLPHDLQVFFPVFLSVRQVLQSTQPPVLPLAPLRPNQSLSEDSLLDSVPAFFFFFSSKLSSLRMMSPSV